MMNRREEERITYRPTSATSAFIKKQMKERGQKRTEVIDEALKTLMMFQNMDLLVGELQVIRKEVAEIKNKLGEE